MANGITALRKIQLGPETTAGTAVAATTIWRGIGVLNDDRTPERVDEQIGIALPTTRYHISKEAASVSFNPVVATFQQLPYLFEAGVSIETPTQDGAGSGYIYAYSMPTTAANTLRTYTIEYGDNQLVQESAYCFIEKFNISGNAAEGVMMSADWLGRTTTDTTFTGALSAPTLLPGHHLEFGGSTLAIDAVGGTLGATAVSSTLLSFELDVTTGYRPKWTNLAKYFDFVYWDVDTYDAKLKLVYEHNASADAQRDLFEAATARQLRLQFTGAALSSAGTTYSLYTFRIDAAGVYTEFKVGEKDGNSINEATLEIGYDATAGIGLDFLVVNESSTLP